MIVGNFKAVSKVFCGSARHQLFIVMALRIFRENPIFQCFRENFYILNEGDQFGLKSFSCSLVIKFGFWWLILSITSPFWWCRPRSRRDGAHSGNHCDRINGLSFQHVQIKVVVDVGGKSHHGMGSFPRVLPPLSLILKACLNAIGHKSPAFACERSSNGKVASLDKRIKDPSRLRGSQFSVHYVLMLIYFHFQLKFDNFKDPFIGITYIAWQRPPVCGGWDRTKNSLSMNLRIIPIDERRLFCMCMYCKG